MTNYQKGARIEYKARDILESYGFFVVRSAGSHGKVDLVATDGKITIYIQCKKQGADDPKDYVDLMGFSKMFMGPAKKITRVELWEYLPGGDWLRHYIERGDWKSELGLDL